MRKIVEAMTGLALARCHQRGIDPADFFEAILAERKAGSACGVSGLFRRVFRRLKAMEN